MKPAKKKAKPPSKTYWFVSYLLRTVGGDYLDIKNIYAEFNGKEFEKKRFEEETAKFYSDCMMLKGLTCTVVNFQRVSAKHYALNN
ncbi:hypothetical protein HN643_04550 [Candidatus Falkowbacteria bacterium]|jgi:hypothetical protein|nr:hypothetical protein [Candidatus Falkowbacteria bacterium]MBT5503289.1 hypothetical protein [Candidatus Falkowbacteria bacterium]MBT6574502.1 hypothetical protein [Candidatus Falkowbacteria bacterium]MBT7500910.1 hypothetical protein [Candidatus Falkowbacteria bacterium]